MRLLRNSRKACLISFTLCTLLAIGGCKYSLKDTEWFGDAGPLGAYAFWTFKEGGRDIPKKEWDEMRFGMICTTPDSFAAWKGMLLKLCEDSGKCTFEIKKTFKSMDAKLAVHQERRRKSR